MLMEEVCCCRCRTDVRDVGQIGTEVDGVPRVDDMKETKKKERTKAHCGGLMLMVEDWSSC